ncbi:MULTISPECIES: hypothetical protein [Nocardioides]|uniref:Uncharacterized protein n=1 Tax=Nocardioides vastitatis TaxID=2568655 RepID=A0ABW0ZH21_9ACTN|nr:hypothetical protein [Nocardioides sp.]THJ05505.1 hypothetical protein E7Z54_07305 [Nocardioides sp.]
MKKLKTLVLVGALGGIVAAVAKKLQAGGAGTGSSWQSATGSRPSASEPPPAPMDVDAAPEEVLVDNAPAPADLPDELPEDSAERLAPDPLTDPLPEVTGEDDEPRL